MVKQDMLYKLMRGIFFFFLCFHCSIIYSQNQLFSYHGIVRDATTKDCLPGATITLQTSDGSLLVGNICGKDGEFTLKYEGTPKNGENEFILHCSYVGYEDYSISIPHASNYDLGTIELNPSSQLLKDVVVTYKRSLFKFDQGSYLAKISNTSLSKLSSLNNILKRLPLLTGDNGSFAVRGRGQAIIYINEREVRDPLEVQNLDASQIESIRIITNPGVSYPIGTNAVIKVNLKKSQEKYWGLVAESQLYQRKRLSGYHTLRMNYTKKRLSIMSVLRAESTQLDPEVDINYQVLENSGDLLFNVDGKSQINKLRYSFDTSLDYQLNDNYSIGYYFSSSINPPRTSVLESSYRKNDKLEGSHTSLNTNKKYEINGALYFLGNLNNTKINLQNFSYNAVQNGSQSLFMDNEKDYDMDTKSFSFLNDAKVELSNNGLGGSLNYGAQWIFTKREDQSVIHMGNGQDDKVMVLQHLVSPFFSYQWTNDIFAIDAGIRMEWEKKAFPYQERESTSHLYWNPKIGISYTSPNNISSSFYWQTFIARPQYFILSGITTKKYPFLYQSGNPFLKSTLVNKLNFDFSYKDLIIQLNANHIQNGLISSFQYDKKTEVIRQTFENRPTHWEFGLATIYSIKPLPFWTIDFYGDVGYANFSYGDNPKREYFNKISYFVDATNRFDLPYDFTLNLYSGYFRSLSGTEESLGTGGISGSIEKFFFNRKLYISLNIGQYIQKRNRIRIEMNNIMINELKDTSNQYIGLSLKYTLNTIKKKHKNITSEEIQRLK